MAQRFVVLVALAVGLDLSAARAAHAHLVSTGLVRSTTALPISSYRSSSCFRYSRWLFWRDFAARAPGATPSRSCPRPGW